MVRGTGNGARGTGDLPVDAARDDGDVRGDEGPGVCCHLLPPRGRGVLAGAG